MFNRKHSFYRKFFFFFFCERCVKKNIVLSLIRLCNAKFDLNSDLMCISFYMVENIAFCSNFDNLAIILFEI